MIRAVAKLVAAFVAGWALATVALVVWVGRRLYDDLTI